MSFHLLQTSPILYSKSISPSCTPPNPSPVLHSKPMWWSIWFDYLLVASGLSVFIWSLWLLQSKDFLRGPGSALSVFVWSLWLLQFKDFLRGWQVHFLFSFGARNSCSSRISWGDSKCTYCFHLDLWHLVVQGFLQVWWCYCCTRLKLLIMPFQFQKPWHKSAERKVKSWLLWQ